MPSIKLESVSLFVCQNLDLAIEDHEFFVLLGPNGSGKTTVLSVIGGLVPYHGSLFFDGICMDQVPASRRW